MQFSGLQSLLKARTKAKPSALSNESASPSNDVYSMTLATARAARPSEEKNSKDLIAPSSTTTLKRPRSPSLPAPPPVIATPAPPSEIPAVLTQTEFDTKCAAVIKTLEAAAEDMKRVWAKGSTTLQLPAALQQYLLDAYVHGTLGERDNGRTLTAVEEDEAALLRCATSEPSAVSSASPAVSTAADVAELAAFAHALWFLVVLHWSAAMTGRQDGESTANGRHGHAEDHRGWTHAMYLRAHHVTPSDSSAPNEVRAVAAALERWASARRTREAALELLAYVVHDYTRMCVAAASADTAEKKTTPAREGVHPPSPDGLIIPADLRQRLVLMLVQHVQRERNFVAARQDYVDLTMGNANWKLGLFSGGEVHMRRSMERVERNRIAHLLNNERAMGLMHAVRELVQFAEKQLSKINGEQFFLLESRTV